MIRPAAASTLRSVGKTRPRCRQEFFSFRLLAILRKYRRSPAANSANRRPSAGSRSPHDLVDTNLVAQTHSDAVVNESPVKMPAKISARLFLERLQSKVALHPVLRRIF